MFAKLMYVFIEATAFMSDSQYYALILILSLAFGCVVVLAFERLQCWWRTQYSPHFAHDNHRKNTFKKAA